MTQAARSAQDWFAEGVIHLDSGRQERARQCFVAALALDPGHAKAANNLGAALQWLGQLDEAEAAYRQALAANPQLAQAWYNLGDLARERGLVDEAAAHIRRALELDGTQGEWHGALAWVLGIGAKPAQALACLREAVRLEPDSASLQEHFGEALLAAGEAEAALEAFRRAAELLPALPTPHSRALATLHLVPGETADSIYLAHAAWAREHPAVAIRRHGNDTSPERKLRVAYLAPDFADPALACLIEPVLASHDPAAIHVTCFSDAATEAPEGWRLRSFAAVWLPSAHLDNWHLSVRIREERIDILVDLGGHAAGGNRMALLAARPAPVQLSWPSYPGTTGLEAVDARLCDWQSSPDGDARFYVERLLRVPGRQWCFRPQAAAALATAIPSAGNGHVTFGAFHGMQRVTPESMAFWSAALRAVPGSRLVLRAAGAVDLAGELGERFRREGIDPARIDCEERLPLAAHLAAHGRIDVWLDARPWSNVAGTFYALWMGVPVVTSRGNTIAGRGASDVLLELGLDAWVGDDIESAAAAAAALAADAPARARWRSELRPLLESSAWMDAERHTRGLERAYREQWQVWCAGKHQRAERPRTQKPRAAIAADLVIAVDGLCFQKGWPEACAFWRALLEAWGASGFARHVVLLERGDEAPVLPEVPGLRRRPIAAQRGGSLEDEAALLQEACDAEGAQIFVSTGYTAPLSTRTVMVVSDMIPEMLGMDLTLPEWAGKHECIRRAPRFITLTRQGGHDVTRFHGMIKPRLSAVYPGVSDVFRLASDAEIAGFKARHGLVRPYFVAVGARERKDRNGRALFRALARLGEGAGYGVLCVGGEPELPAEALRLCPNGDLRRLDLDEAGRRLAYAGALALVHVPLDEGFPAPVVEAMRCGCPVIASAHGALPEVAGEAALFVDPADAAGLALAMQEVQAPALRARLVARGMERARGYTWERAAREIADLLQETAQEKSPADAIRAP